MVTVLSRLCFDHQFHCSELFIQDLSLLDHLLSKLTVVVLMAMGCSIVNDDFLNSAFSGSCYHWGRTPVSIRY